MNPSPDTPVYNLKAVVRETGLKPDTIRAWERRYGLPEPQRTESGHRLYSQKDMSMLKWLIARQNEGMSISRAVELWRRLAETQDEPDGRLFQTIHTTSFTPSLTGRIPTSEQSVSTTLDANTQVREAWLNACLAFDELGAERALTQAFALFPIEVVCVELIQRGLAVIGEGWYHGRVTVQQEHFASALATRRLETLLLATPPPTRPSRILVGCPSLEMHTFAPMLLTLLLRRRSWDVLFLGGDIPLENLINTTRAARPQLVILVAQQIVTAANLLEMGQLLLNERVPLAFGGRPFAQLAELRQRIPGHYLGDHLEDAPQQVENLLALPRIQNVLMPVAPEYQDMLRQFKSRLPQIEAEVWRAASSVGILLEHLAQANTLLGNNISAALMLGNLDYLRPALAILNLLFKSHYDTAEHLLASYLQAYVAALALLASGPGDQIRGLVAAARLTSERGVDSQR